MMKLKTVEVGPEYAYDTVKVTLNEDATKRVVAAIVAEAMASLSFDAESINVVGKPGKVKPVDDVLPINQAALDELAPL